MHFFLSNDIPCSIVSLVYTIQAKADKFHDSNFHLIDMVFLLDGRSEYNAHVWTETGLSW